MVFALKDARRELSKDLGDYYFQTTTGAGTTATVVSAPLTEQDVDDFVTKPSTVYIVGGQTNGPSSDEERRIAEEGLVTDTITVRRAFSAMATGLEFEVHRLFTGEEKNDALNKALNLIVPIVWKHVSTTVTVVADQHEYSLSAAGFYRNEPHQVNLVSDGDTEHEFPIYGTEMRGASTLYLPYLPGAGRTIRLRGIGTAAISDMDDGELSILTARAGMYLAEQGQNQGPQDRRTFFQELGQRMERSFAERVTRFMKPAPPKNYRTEALGTNVIDTNWRLP